MNLDFHYNATHLAALCAGFSPSEAVLIAKSAQMVDDLTLDWLDSAGKIDRSLPVGRQTVTCMSMTELAGYFVQQTPFTAQQQAQLRETWMAFHFPPGNLQDSCAYEGEEQVKAMGWTISQEDRELFRLLCLPGSEFIGRAVNDTAGWRERPFFLHLLGIRMHLLADSWAHSGFLGFPRMHANDVLTDRGVFVEKGGEWKRVTLNDNRSLVVKDSLDKLEFATTPPAVLPTSQLWAGVSYLAHGRIGSIADYGCLKFRYAPFYKSRGGEPEQVRDNVVSFSKAFHQMVSAMKCLKRGGQFDPAVVPDDYNRDILPVLRTWKLDQSPQWDDLCEKMHGIRPPAYHREEWMKKDSADFSCYLEAVKLHRQLFRDALYC